MLSLAARTAAFYAPRTASLRLVRHAASRAERELELWKRTVPMLKDELRSQGLKVGRGLTPGRFPLINRLDFFPPAQTEWRKCLRS